MIAEYRRQIWCNTVHSEVWCSAGLIRILPKLCRFLTRRKTWLSPRLRDPTTSTHGTRCSKWWVRSRSSSNCARNSCWEVRWWDRRSRQDCRFSSMISSRSCLHAQSLLDLSEEPRKPPIDTDYITPAHETPLLYITFSPMPSRWTHQSRSQTPSPFGPEHLNCISTAFLPGLQPIRSCSSYQVGALRLPRIPERGSGDQAVLPLLTVRPNDLLSVERIPKWKLCSVRPE